MSRLYHTECGRVIPSLGEELTRYRRARKVLELPATARPARLFMLARAYPGSAASLHISVNSHELAPLAPGLAGQYCWYEVTVPTSALRVGPNTFELWTDSEAMDGWSLALEHGHPSPASFVSTDCGATWRNHSMGYLNVALGEYVVRLRLAEGDDPAPPAMVWEDRDEPRLGYLRSLLPDAALQFGSPLERVRALNSWVAMQWRYRNSSETPQYAPWDPATILSWGKAERGHDSRPPIVMCVHYAVVMVSCCIAAGIPARGFAGTGSINGWDGHFTAEVWVKEYGKWVMVDPTKDAILMTDEVPLSISEIRRLGTDLLPFVRWGPGQQANASHQGLEAWVGEGFRKGVYYNHRSLWPRTDFLAHPELTPPGHGSTSYCETELVWEEKDRDECAMFPYFADAEYFDAPPGWE